MGVIVPPFAQQAVGTEGATLDAHFVEGTVYVPEEGREMLEGGDVGGELLEKLGELRAILEVATSRLPSFVRSRPTSERSPARPRVASCSS